MRSSDNDHQTGKEISPSVPDPKELVKVYAEVARRASSLIGEHIQRQMKKGISMPNVELGFAQAFMDMMAKLLSNPYKLAQTQMSLIWDYYALWQNSMQRFMDPHTVPLITPEKGDCRFEDRQWEEHFLFDFIKQTYLITARHVRNTISSIEGLDEHTQQKISFLSRQYIDALSPSNFVLTNPEVFRETIQSNGQNLLRGLNNLLYDLEEGGGQLRIRMTDTKAFDLGKNVATTPGKVILQNDMMQLIQYTPASGKVYKRPLLIVPPWINKFYILDLRENVSYIKWCVDQGHTVFVISWGNPDKEQAEKTFDSYMLEGVIAALDAIEQQTGAKEVNAVGYCLGGTLLATTLGYLAAKRQKRIASAGFFATLTDFSQPGELGIFIDDEQISCLEKKMFERGYFDSADIVSAFSMLQANDLTWSFVVNNYLLGKDPFPFDLLYWISDSTHLPARMHSFYLRSMYLQNKLIEPGGIIAGGVPIDLSKVKIPCYFISAIDDNIAPWKSTYIGARYFSGPVRFVLGGSGHIAGIVNPPAANKYGYWLNSAAKLVESPDTWLANAQQYPGSWWTDWNDWIVSLDSGQTEAHDPLKGKLKPLEDAPGSFAKMRLSQ